VLYSSQKIYERTVFMTLYDELFFEIEFKGVKSDIKKLISFLKSGVLDDFFEFSTEYITYDDEYDNADLSAKTEIAISNDDCGIELEEFDTDEFLEVLCRAARSLEVCGHIYDINDEEYHFVSEAGDSYYLNSRKVLRFNEDDDLGEADPDYNDGDEDE